jgi:hypothetical protein
VAYADGLAPGHRGQLGARTLAPADAGGRHPVLRAGDVEDVGLVDVCATASEAAVVIALGALLLRVLRERSADHGDLGGCSALGRTSPAPATTLPVATKQFRTVKSRKFATRSPKKFQK